MDLAANAESGGAGDLASPTVSHDPVAIRPDDDLAKALLEIASNYREVLDYEELVTLSDAAGALYLAAHDTRSALVAGGGESAKLRKIISDCATALGNGAHISPDCSIEFMSGLPNEIKLHLAALQTVPASLDNERQEPGTSRNLRINKLILDLWAVFICNDPEAQIKANRIWNLLDAFDLQIRALQTAPAGLDAETRKVLDEVAEIPLEQDICLSEPDKIAAFNLREWISPWAVRKARELLGRR